MTPDIIQPLHGKLNLPKRIFFVGVFTFLTGGLTITSSKLSSAFIVWKFSCSMAIFFSLSQPDGLVHEGKGYKSNSGFHTVFKHTHTHKHLHEDSISFHHLCGAVEGKTIESVDQIFVKNVQVFHFLH